MIVKTCVGVCHPELLAKCTALLKRQGGRGLIRTYLVQVFNGWECSGYSRSKQESLLLVNAAVMIAMISTVADATRNRGLMRKIPALKDWAKLNRRAAT